VCDGASGWNREEEKWGGHLTKKKGGKGEEETSTTIPISEGGGRDTTCDRKKINLSDMVIETQ